MSTTAMLFAMNAEGAYIELYEVTCTVAGNRLPGNTILLKLHPLQPPRELAMYPATRAMDTPDELYCHAMVKRT